MNTGVTQSWGKSLEDAFFAENDKILIEQLAAMRRMKETIASLSKVSGIANEKILKKLVELNVRPETLAALALVPLVEMAWADGDVDAKEEAAVLAAAAESLSGDNHIEMTLLKEWLERKPATQMLQAWTHYTEGLCENMGEADKKAFRRAIMKNVRAVAEASGGFLGLGNKISAAEEKMLKKLDAAFGC